MEWATLAEEAIEELIVIGKPTAFGSIEEAASLKTIELAVKEINASGGIDVGGEHRRFQIFTIETRE